MHDGDRLTRDHNPAFPPERDPARASGTAGINRLLPQESHPGSRSETAPATAAGAVSPFAASAAPRAHARPHPDENPAPRSRVDHEPEPRPRPPYPRPSEPRGARPDRA